MNNGYSFRGVLPSVLLVVFVSFAFFLSRSMPSPLLLAIEGDLGIRHAASSRSMVFFTVGYAAAMVLSGFLSARVVHRRVVMVAGSIGVIGLVIVSASSGLTMFRTGLLIFGAGFGLFSPTIISIITSIVEKRDWSRALAINELSPHLGMILAPLIAAALASLLPWRAMFVIVALLLATTVALFARFSVDVDRKGSAPSFATMGVLVRTPMFWLLIVYFSVALAGVDGVYLLIPTFLVTEAGMTAAAANAVFGVSRMLPIGALVVGAFVFHRIGIGKTIAFALVGSGASVVLLGLTGGIARIVFVFLQPMIGALYFPAGFAALSSLLPNESRNVGVSMILPVSVILGVGVIPSFLGAMGDYYSFALGFVGIGAVMVGVGSIPLIFSFDPDETEVQQHGH